MLDDELLEVSGDLDEEDLDTEDDDPEEDDLGPIVEDEEAL